MAGGGLAPTGGKEFEAKITVIVVISCIMAATGGLMFGYDVGVSGHHPRTYYMFFFMFCITHAVLLLLHDFYTYTKT